MADVSVRAATPDDAEEIARIQLTTWRTAYRRLLPADGLAAVTEVEAAARWRQAVAAPPSPRHRVLVAYEQDWRVGFAAAGPAAEDTGDGGGAEDPATLAVATLLVEPRWGRRGHGSRLLAALVDHARADGLTSAVVWLLERDARSQAFFGSAGWEPDGATRALDVDGLHVPEVRLHTSLEQDVPVEATA